MPSITDHLYAPRSIELPSKPGASIKYRFFPGRPGKSEGGPNQTLVVFLNGLLTTMDTWLPTISGLREQIEPSLQPAILSYDRYGQGLTTDRDPLDKGREPGHGHDCTDAAKDLHELLNLICREHFNRPLSETFNLLLVGNSIGCAIARLFTPICPIPIKAFLFLDSIMANSDFDLWPNPDSPGFDPKTLPPDLPVQALREQREAFLSRFSPHVSNKEGLSRKNLQSLLPHSHEPSLIKGSVKPWITVVGHDPEVFAKNSFEQMGTSMYLSREFTNPTWERYHRGMTRLTSLERNRDGAEPVVAVGAGHFIQVDRPDLVVVEIRYLLECVQGTE